MQTTFKYKKEEITINLTEEFQKAIEIMNNNESIFITGKAGTGKSTLLKYYRSQTLKNIAVLSFTGLAAINVDGSTIHSFFGFPLGFLESKSIKYNKRLIDILSSVDVIIIDEVSMVRADLMDAIDKSLRIHRGIRQPFGGVQMIFIGDLYQLSPIVDKGLGEIYGHFYKSPYFFDANVFKLLRFPLINLENIHRQKDPTFIEILNNVRDKINLPETLEKLNEKVTNDFSFLNNDDTIVLTTTNFRSKQINDLFLNQLKTLSNEFHATIEGNFDRGSYPTESHLILKEGAKVILIKNDQDGQYVNGDFGIIKKFNRHSIDVEVKGMTISLKKAKWEKKKYSLNIQGGIKRIGSEVIGTFEQYPLKLAWAISIHKSQGQTYDKVIIDLESGSFTHGQTYVALSRCKTLEGIKLKRPVAMEDIILDERVKEYKMYFESVL